jgi:hypothetical protein
MPLFGTSHDRSRFDRFLQGERVVIIMSEHAYPSIADLIQQSVGPQLAALQDAVTALQNAPQGGVDSGALDALNARIDALEENLDAAFAASAPVSTTPVSTPVDTTVVPPADTTVDTTVPPPADTTVTTPPDSAGAPTEPSTPPVDLPPGAMPTGN